MKVFYLVLITVCIQSMAISQNQITWIDPDNDLPSDIELTLSQLSCSMDYDFPNCIWVENNLDTNGVTWPFPLIEGVHFESNCGTAVFTSTHSPCSIDPRNGNIDVTYTVEDGCNRNQ